MALELLVQGAARNIKTRGGPLDVTILGLKNGGDVPFFDLGQRQRDIRLGGTARQRIEVQVRRAQHRRVRQQQRALERDRMFRSIGSYARFVSLLDRMRRGVETQRERARTRGLLELRSLIGSDNQSAVNRTTSR